MLDCFQDAFQYLAESVRKAEESGETEQASLRAFSEHHLACPRGDPLQVETAKRRRLEAKPSTPSRKDRS